MAWVCSKCTYLNPSTQKSTCSICLSLPSSSSSPSISSASPLQWSCKACTFSNPFGQNSCEICGTRSTGSLLSTFVDLGSTSDEEVDATVGSVFLPLQPCKRKFQSKIDGESEGKSDGFHEPDEFRAVKAKKEVYCVSGDPNPDSDAGSLKILSYNVWFREDLEMTKRMEALGDLIQQYSPDLICLQEVTPNIYKVFQQSSWWKVYCCSVSNEMEIERAYFCMQLSKLPVKRFSSKPFRNSMMGRELCVADVDIGMGKNLILATSHLESPCPGPPKWDQMFSPERVTQAKEALSFLKDSPNAIFGGDMNWDEKLDGGFPLAVGWVDAWSVLRPGENGFTYDTKANQMLSGNRTLQKRLDRFMCNLQDFKISAIEMIGMEPIPGLTYCKEKKVRKELKKLVLPVLPSDHYGLLLTIRKL